MKKILVTGAAGFIGFHLSKKLCNENYYVVGIDNLNDYYSVDLKMDRLNQLKKYSNFEFKQLDLVDKQKIDELFKAENFDYVVNLAAQAGVRYSIENPYAYIDSNIRGFINILEACRYNPVKHLLYASSSSVYGGNTKVPFSVEDSVDHPVSLYAATKKSNELMAHAYSSLYNIPSTGLRFFTVYGPWGRPDMAYFSFSQKILKDETIKIFNHGKMERDFTYIDDITESISRLIPMIPEENNEWTEEFGVGTSYAPYRIMNIGNSNPVPLMTFVETLEKYLGKKAKKEYLEMQAGDVKRTYADTSELEELIDYKPQISLNQGIKQFVEWFKDEKKYD